MPNNFEQYQTLTQQELNQKLLQQCSSGNLEAVRYLLHSPNLKQHAQIHDFSFCAACLSGHLEVVKYLLISPELKENGIPFANIHADNNKPFYWACSYGHLDIVKYFLTSSDLVEKNSFSNENKDYGFFLACKNQHLHIVQYFIFEMDLPLNQSIRESLGNDVYSPQRANEAALKQQILTMFKNRETYHRLNANLKNKLNKQKQLKI